MQLRVMTYNTHLQHGKDLWAIVGVIQEAKPDAVGLVEISSAENARWLGDHVGMSGVAFAQADNDYHVAWLTNQNIVRKHHHETLSVSKPLVELVINVNGVEVQLFALHLTAGCRRPTRALARNDEIGEVLTRLHQNATHPHLLVGDFNALAPGDILGQRHSQGGVSHVQIAPEDPLGLTIKEVTDRHYVDCYRNKHPDVMEAPGYTYSAADPWLRLDYTFASPEMAKSLRACEVLMSDEACTASDHLPVWAEFDL